jgi:hypothetical protein
MNVCRGARRSIFSRIFRTKTSTVRSRCVSRRPQTRWSSSSRVTTELGRREAGVHSVHVGLDVARVDPQLLDLDRLASHRPLWTHAAASRRLHSGDELAHREGLHEVVVGSDLECVHAVVLRPARADDDDRRADALAARRLDEPPAVDLREHEVEDADVRVLEAQAGEPLLALGDPDGVVPGGRKVPRHSLPDHLVVLDDENLRHRFTGMIVPEARTTGAMPVKIR